MVSISQSSNFSFFKHKKEEKLEQALIEDKSTLKLEPSNHTVEGVQA